MSSSALAASLRQLRSKLVAQQLSIMLLTVGPMAGVGLWLRTRSQAVPAPQVGALTARADERPKNAPDQREPAKTMKIEGRVLGPNGAAKAGAKLLLAGDGETITQLGVTAADGRFAVAVPKEPKYKRLFRYLIARAEGAGIDFLDLSSLTTGKPVELRLVKDHVVRGRVVNTEGKPVAGVRVVAETVSIHIGNSLDSFLAAYIKILAGGKGTADQKVLWHGGDPLFADTTDADGRFALYGIGAERTAKLLFRGGGIADRTLLYVANRAGFDPEPYNKQFRDYFALANGRRDQRWIPAHLLYGPDIHLVAESEKVIRGNVTDADTGKGQAGLTVWLAGYGDQMNLPTSLTAKTDAEGRYTIHGARKAKRYLVQSASDETSGYTPSQVWADDTAAYHPVVADLNVKKGVVVTGKVIDGATGKAIPGWAIAAVLPGNPYIKDYKYDKFFPPSGRSLDAHSGQMDADGAYRLVTLPGPVSLSGGPDYQKMGDLDALRYGDFRRVLDIKPGIALVKQDILLERASEQTVTIQDGENRSVRGVWVTGISARSNRAIRVDGDSCPIYQLEAGKPRLMVCCEPQRKLAAALTLKGDEKSPIFMKLGPTGSIEGRLLDAGGKPLAGVEVDLHYRESQVQEIETTIHEGKQIVTDADGAFLLDTLIPEMKFELKFRRGRRPFERVTKAAAKSLQVHSGISRDLGAIKLSLVADKPRR